MSFETVDIFTIKIEQQKSPSHECVFRAIVTVTIANTAVAIGEVVTYERFGQKSTADVVIASTQRAARLAAYEIISRFNLEMLQATAAWQRQLMETTAVYMGQGMCGAYHDGE